jgi:hypothetical protein
MLEKEKIKSAPLLSTNKLETTIQENNVESLGDTPFGTLFAEVFISPKGKKTYINRYVYQEDKVIPINYPPKYLEPDMFYPYRELQMTQSSFNEADYVPADTWVKESFRDDNGQLIRDTSGRAIDMYFWCKLSIKSLREEEEFKYGPIQYILGSDITKYIEAKQIVGGSLGNTVRQRIEEEEMMVEA